MKTEARLEVSAGAYRLPSILIAAGGAVVVYGLFAAPDRAWLNILLNGFYVMSLALSATFFLALQRLAGARWSAGIRRIPEAFLQILPVGAVLILALFVGGRGIYPWSHPEALSHAHAHAAAGREEYLRVPFVFGRYVVAFALWGLFMWLFRKASTQQDKDPARNLLYHRRLDRYAGIFMLVFAPTFTVSAFDWILSLEPEWFSTMFAFYVFAGTFVQGLAAITLVGVLLKQRGLLGEELSEHVLHDLGKLLFAFSTFWAYIWVCQYLLIWYGDLPEEVPYYVTRTHGSWLPVFALNFIVNWAAPFIGLLRVGAKRNLRVLKTVSIVILLGRWLDLYLLIMPSKWAAPKIGLLEVAIAAGCAALCYLIVVRALTKTSLVPVNDPILVAQRSAVPHAHP